MDRKSYLSHMGKVVLCGKLFPRMQKDRQTLEHMGLGGFLHHLCLLEEQGLGKVQIVKFSQ